MRVSVCLLVVCLLLVRCCHFVVFIFVVFYHSFVVVVGICIGYLQGFVCLFFVRVCLSLFLLFMP